MTTDEAARVILNNEPKDIELEDVAAMAKFWLLKDEIIREMKNNWDYDHSDPEGTMLDELLAKITGE